MDTHSVTTQTIVILILGIGLFLFLREVVCWYFKFNKISSLLASIEKNTRPKEVVPEKEIKQTTLK